MAIFIPLLIVNQLFIPFQILMMFLVLVAANEMVKLYEKDKKFPPFAKFIIIIFTAVIYLAALAQIQGPNPGEMEINPLRLFNINVEFLPIFLFTILILFLFLVIYDTFNAADIGKALMVICYVGLGFAAITTLRYIGLRFIIYLFIITILTDVFAYLFGVRFGKHKMCPNISPKKSWEGAIAGTVCAAIIGTIYAFFYGALFGNIFGPENATTIIHGLFNMDAIPQVGQFFIILGVSVFASIAGQIGDLVASKLKRTYSIKDFGNIFPGHGGVLDRLDSALFASLFLLTLFRFFMSVIGTV